MAFSFGGISTGGAPAPAAGGGGGFSFSTTAATTTTTSAGTTGNAPSTGTTGFSFGGGGGGGGGGTSSSSAPATATSSSSSAFGFGGGGLSSSSFGAGFGGGVAGPTTSSSSSSSSSPSPSPPVVFTMPSFDETFGNWKLWRDVTKWLNQYYLNMSEDANDDDNDDDIDTDNNSIMAGQELAHAVLQLYRHELRQPTLPAWTPPNQALRQRMVQQQQRTIGISIIPSGRGRGGGATSTTTTPTTTTTTTTLTPKVLERILHLATDLRISEEQATCLYAKVVTSSEGTTTDDDSIASALLLGGSSSSTLDAAGYNILLDTTNPNANANACAAEDSESMAAAKMARDFYFFERHLRLETLLRLVQSRLLLPNNKNNNKKNKNNNNNKNNQYLLEATDALLQENLIPHLIQLVQESTQRIHQLQQEINAAAAAAEYASSAVAAASSSSFSANNMNMNMNMNSMMNMMQGGGGGSGGMYPASSSAYSSTDDKKKKKKTFAHVHLVFYQQERQTACEILFFLAYHTQWKTNEVTLLIDWIREWTNQVPAPCPFTNVPSPYENNNATTTGGAANGNTNTYTTFYTTLQDKPFAKWQSELVDQVVHGGGDDGGGESSSSSGAAGQPQVWQCLSLLIVTAMAAMETHQVLYCRDTHALQDYVGNALLPPPPSPHGAGAGAGAVSYNGVVPLQERLTHVEQWPRPDVGGLILSPYVLLLRSSMTSSSSASSPSSPFGGAGGVSPSRTGSDASVYSQMARDHLSTPADLQSFTLMRLIILPCLQRLSSSSLSAAAAAASASSCQVISISEFASSILAEHLAHYFESLPPGHLPLSRERWRVEEEEQLQLRRDAAARAQQFQAWQYGQQQGGGGFGGMMNNNNNKNGHHPSQRPKQQQPQEVIPTSVDLMTRPDCLDDLVAVAVAICALGPDYARSFRKSRTLQELARYQAKDPSLLPAYLSWLAALSNNETNATAVYQLLLGLQQQDGSTTTSTPASTMGGITSTIDEATATNGADAATNRPVASSSANNNNNTNLDWHKIIFNLRWYAQELSGDAKVSVSSTSSGSTSNSNNKSSSSTSYYYNLEGDFVQDQNNNASSTTGSSSGAGGGNTNTPGNGSSSSNNTDPASSKNKELSDTSRFYLASHLAVLRNVALHSAKARHGLLKIQLPVAGSNTTGFAAGADETLLILFKLAIAPLPPNLRGATLATIASLLRPASAAAAAELSKEEQSFLLEQAKHGWEYLETCPLLPIALCDQYRVLSTVEDRALVALAFPPSSLALANSASATTATASLLPKDPTYGLFYELEHVESQLGWYPSTEGCLELLHSLVSSAGCPATLGQNWRFRTGVAPYLEYITSLVLPRVLGTAQGCSKLYFRVPGDQSRLATKALSVLEAILTRYSIPTTKALKNKDLPPDGATATAETLLGIPTIAQQVTSTPPMATTPKEAEQWVDDFRNKSISSVVMSNNSNNNNDLSNNTPTAVAMTGNIPRAKSPGFCIMTDLLSPCGGGLFEVLALVLAGHGGARSIQSVFGGEGDDMALAYATYGSTVPNMTSAREGAKEGEPTKPKQTLLMPLLPSIQDLVLDGTSFDDGALWREKSIRVALSILCAAAAREEAFSNAVAASPEPLNLVPVLRFQAIRYGSSNLKVMDVSVSSLSNLLYTTTNSQYIRAAIIEYIGYKASNDELDAQLSGAALALTYFLQLKMRSTSQGVRGWMDHNMTALLSRAIANRLLLSSRRPTCALDYQSTSLILNWILADLRAGMVMDGSLVQVLLGLPTSTQGGNWSPERALYPSSLDDCFDAILELLQDVDYTSSKEQSAIASSCLEILFRLYDLMGTTGDLRVAVYTAQRLRAVDFWKTNLLLWLSSRGTEPLSRASSTDLHESNPEAVHCMAWLLKGLACELNLLVGFAGDSIWALDSALAGFISPRPVLCRRLLDLMFGSDEPLVPKLLDSLPLHIVAMDPDLRYPPHDALRAGVEGWPGPSDVVAGYDHVNKAKVLKVIQSNGGAGQDLLVESSTAWIDHWNSIVSRNCAASHLSNAVSMMLDAALDGNEAFQATGVDPFATCFSPNNLMELAFRLLERMLEGSGGQISRGMDSNLYSKSSRNLGNSVLLLVETMTRLDKNQWSNSTEFLLLTSRIASAIAYSSIGDDSDAEAPTRHERTTVLGSALSMLLRATAQAEPDLLLQYRDDLLLAAKSLARLSTFELTGESSSVVSILARSSLSTMIETCSDEEDDKGSSFCFQLMTHDLSGSFMGLVSRMDVNICSLLQSIASQPYGAETLINARLLDAMESAARSYAKEESEVAAKAGSDVGGFRQVKIMAPDFLIGHLKLLSTVMASSTLPHHYLQTLPEHALQILRHYKSTFHRLCYNFPFEGDILRAFLRCFVQSTCLASPSDPSDRYNELKPTFRRNFRDLFYKAGFFEGGIVILCKQLLEHPMPASLLPPPPQALQDQEEEKKEAGPGLVVKVESDKQQSWWDVLEVLLATREAKSRFSFNAPVGSGDFAYWGSEPPKKWSENKFEYAVVAADVLSLGLSLLRKHDRSEDLKRSIVEQGLHQFTLASEGIQRRLDEVRLNDGGVPLSTFMDMEMNEGENDDNENPELEAEYLSLLGASVARCVEELRIRKSQGADATAAIANF